MVIELLVLIPLTFTAPAGDTIPGSSQPVVEYGVQILDHLGVQSMALVYGDSIGNTRPIPKAVGAPERIFVWLAEDWHARLFTVWSKDAAGKVSGPSNGVIAAAGRLAAGSSFKALADAPDRFDIEPPLVKTSSSGDTVFWYTGTSPVKENRARWSWASMNPEIRMVKWTLYEGSWDIRPSFGGSAMSEALRPYGAIVRDDVLQTMSIGCSCRPKDWP